MKLYEIAGELGQAIDHYADGQTLEELAELEAKVTALEIPFTEKVINVGFVTRNVDANINAIADEIKRLSALKKTEENKLEWLTRYLKSAMEHVGILKVEDARIKVSIQKNPKSVNIVDEAKIPDSYKRLIPARTEPDKKLIKEAWEKGVGVEGTEIIDTNTRLVIR